MSETAAVPWTANKPEQRLSIAVDRLFKRTLLPPCYFTALHDADGTKRTDNQRARDTNRGVKSGQLDWDVVQGLPTLIRKVELKRGDNDLSTNQRATIAALTACGAAPIVAWSLREVHAGMARAGFRFTPNVQFVLADLEQHLAAWDREAEAIKAGTPLRKKKARKPKAQPRFLMSKSVVSRARKAGVRV